MCQVHSANYKESRAYVINLIFAIACEIQFASMAEGSKVVQNGIMARFHMSKTKSSRCGAVIAFLALNPPALSGKSRNKHEFDS